jgi:N-methylhydantoinase A
LTNRIGIDIGGTFTDLVIEGEKHLKQIGKVLTTPDNLVEGVLKAIEISSAELDETKLFIHGTTVGINSILERKGARVALLTTAGFKDVYIIGRGHRPDMFNLKYQKPLPLLKREDIFEVRERISAGGKLVDKIDFQSLASVLKDIKKKGFEAVAVSLLHSYINPDHELKVRSYFHDHFNSIPIVLSHEVAPEWREYERTSTTVVSAYITPIVKDYLHRLSKELSDKKLKVPVHITQSNGGSMSASQASEQAVLTLFSGPVGGVVGGKEIGRLINQPDMICIDMGGTSFDVSLIRNGEVELKSEFELQGLPILAPSVELVSIALGGGSIIKEVTGGLRVGPESAGSNPGPACYGRGGKMATISDANVVLGRLPLEQLLGGNLKLDFKAAQKSVNEVGSRLGLDTISTAEQALEVAHFKMSQAIRELTVERGLDPREFSICAFGGAGPLHAAFIAEELEIKKIVIPSVAGAFSAWGMLQGDLRHDMTITYFRKFNEAQTDISDTMSLLKKRVLKRIINDGADLRSVHYESSAEMRYTGQEYSLLVPLNKDSADDVLLKSFHDAYFLRYGHSQPDAPVEFVSLRMAGIVDFEKTKSKLSIIKSGGTNPVGETNVFFNGKSVRVPIYSRESIEKKIEGNAIVLEKSTTIIVPREWSILPTKGDHLIMERNSK